jgi:hypothetical protein
MPMPPDNETVRVAVRKLGEIGCRGYLAKWTAEDLTTLARAYELVIDPLESIKPLDRYGFFQMRGALKPFVRRNRNDRAWSELGRTLHINPSGPAELAAPRQIESALAALSRGLEQLKSCGHRHGRSRLRPPWTAKELELIRALIHVGEEHPDRLSDRHTSEYRRATDRLADLLIRHHERIAWQLFGDAIDLELNRSFIDRYTSKIFDDRGCEYEL